MPPLSGNVLEIMRRLWRETEFLFIDEISMIPYEMLLMIDIRLRQLKTVDLPFGGIHVIFFGDLFQLPPVRGSQVFIQPTRMQPAVHLWRLFELIELTENMRQQGDNTFIDLLNALRVGELTTHHLRTLLQRVSTEDTGEFAIGRALRIYPTNNLVNLHNQAVLEMYRNQGDVHMYRIVAKDEIVNSPTALTEDQLRFALPADINKTGGFPTELEIFIGAKVMLRSNVDVSRGLVNGAIGYITNIVWHYFMHTQLHDRQMPRYVEIDFDGIGIHRIEPRTVRFPAKGSYGTVERKQLPLVLSWASTVHKMQGSTVNHAVINLGHSLFAEGQAYVALSRVRSLEGLRIEELESSKLIGKKPCNQKALLEMQRLRNQNRNIPDNGEVNENTLNLICNELEFFNNDDEGDELLRNLDYHAPE